MALAPLLAGTPARFPIQPPGLQTRPDVPALTRAPPLRPAALPEPPAMPERSATSSAEALADEIDAAREGSLEYRLITALLLRDADRDALRQTLNAGDELRRPADATGSQSTVSASASSTTSTSVSASVNTSIAGGAGGTSVSVLSAELTRVDVSLELLPEGMQLQISASRLQVVAVNVSSTTQAGGQRKDPLLLDLDGDGAETSGLGAGTTFDIDGDGRLEQISFASGGDAFLALDRNGNGGIDDGRELFGDQHGAAHGFAELARFDDNSDQRIDSSDAVYQQLRLISWQDGALHTRSLADAGISAIDLDWRDEPQELANGDAIAQSGAYTRSDGSRGGAHDVLISVDAHA